MKFKRLQKVRDFIADLPPKACDMTTWQSISLKKDTDSNEYFSFKEMKKKGFRCGSAACIGGWTEIMVNKATGEEPIKSYYIKAFEYLEMTQEEHEMLFMQFPKSTPEKGWKKWILKRLDGVLKEQEVRPWDEQMKKK